MFVIRGEKITLSHVFRHPTTNVATNPAAATVSVFRYNDDGERVSILADGEMVSEGIAGEYKYLLTVASSVPPRSLCYVRYEGTSGGGDVMNANAAFTVLDQGGFGGGLRASFTG